MLADDQRHFFRLLSLAALALRLGGSKLLLLPSNSIRRHRLAKKFQTHFRRFLLHPVLLLIWEDSQPKPTLKAGILQA